MYPNLLPPSWGRGRAFPRKSRCLFHGSPEWGQQTIRVAAFQYHNALSPQSLPAKRAIDSSLRGVFTAPLTPRFPAGGRLREFLANRPYMPDNVHLKCAIHPSAPSPVGTGIAHARFIANESARKKAARRRLFCSGGLSGSDFFQHRFQERDARLDALDFQVLFFAVEARANRAKAVQRGDTVGRGDVGV